MAGIDATQGLMPTILDRLVDPNSGGTEARRGYGLQQMLEVIRRDLEDLLNTRQSASDLPAELTHVHKSIAMYGLPDLTSFTIVTTQQRDDMATRLEAIVAHHEPRLRDIRVVISNIEESNRPSVRCRIEGRLALDPAPEVSFDTIMEPFTGQHKVRQNDK